MATVTAASERARITENAASRILSGRFQSYKKTDLARALTFSENGTVDILKDRIGERFACSGPEKLQLESDFGLYPNPVIVDKHGPLISS